MMLNWGYKLAAGAVGFTAALAPRLAQACATCGMPADDRGIDTSVVFMLGSPYVIGLIGAGVAFVAYRHGQRRRQEACSDDRPPLNH